jgi:hypothetical protein
MPSLLGSAAGAPGAARDDMFEAARASAGAPPAATDGGFVPQAAQPSSDRAVEVRTSAPVLVSAGGKSTNEPTAAPPAALGKDATEKTEAPGDLAATGTGPAVNPLMAGSLGLLVVGLLLFGLRFAGRRLSG